MIVHNVTRKAQCITIISPALVLLLKHRIHLDSIVVFFLPEGFFCSAKEGQIYYDP